MNKFCSQDRAGKGRAERQMSMNSPLGVPSVIRIDNTGAVPLRFSLPPAMASLAGNEEMPP